MTIFTDELRIYDMSRKDLEEQLIGRSIKSISDNTITLNNGKELLLDNTYSCCAYFEAELKAGNLTDNAITRVNITGEELPDFGDSSWTLHIIAADENICDVSIGGDATSGWYCHSIVLRIKPGKSDN